MTLDLDAVLERFDAIDEWRSSQTGETDAEYQDRVAAEQASTAFASVKDIPALVAEVQRLRDICEPTDTTRIPIWVRVNAHMRKRCEAWYDPTRDGWVLDDHPFSGDIP